MFGDLRRAVVIGAALVFAAGFVVGLIVGRAGGGDDAVAVAVTASPSVTIAPSPSTVVIATPAPNEQPAIPTQGAVLREGSRPLVPAAANAPCQALVTPGAVGECGEVTVSGNRVVWVVERTTTNGITATLARMLSFVSDENGWVEWLQAADPSGEQWSDVNVVPSDLTGDGVPELLVGFRSVGDAQTLEYDIVGYSEAAVPEVLAHPEPAPKGSVIVSAGTVQEYAAQYPNDEPVCCPPTYLRRTIAFEDSFFRVLGSETVVTTAVPPSQL